MAARGGGGAASGVWEGGQRPLVTRGPMFQVHTACKDSLVTKCPLGLCKVSVIPPTALNSIDSDGGCPLLSCSVCPPSTPTLELVILVTSRCGRGEVEVGLRHWGEGSCVLRW